MKQKYTGYSDKNGNNLFDGDKVREWIDDKAEMAEGYFIISTIKQIRGCWVVAQEGFDYSKTPTLELTFLHENWMDVEKIIND